MKPNITKEQKLNLYRRAFLQKWLREKHNIHVECHYQPHARMYVVTTRTISGEEAFYGVKDSHEEALEEGLYEALKLIKDET